jgi:hypothetical protein
MCNSRMKCSFYSRGVMTATKRIFALGLATCCASLASASEDADWTNLRIHRDNGSSQTYHAYPPTTVKMLFPTGDALVERGETPPTWRLDASKILARIQLFRVSDMQRKVTISAAAFGEQLFIFDTVFCGENSSAMKGLILSTNSAPRNKAEALDQTKVYLALSYYELGDPALFIGYRGDDSAPKGNPPKEKKFSDMIGLVHSPQVSRTGAAYSVDLYAHDQAGVPVSNVSHWRLKIDAANFEELMAARHEGYFKEHPENPSRKKYSVNQVQFWVQVMANGFTTDGAETDIQDWAASDGPGLSRIHYYYRSHEKAEARMQEFLKNAISVIETTQRVNPDGRVAGKSALILQVNSDAKTLFASEIFEDETSVLEVSSAGLCNVLAATRSESAAKQH